MAAVKFKKVFIYVPLNEIGMDMFTAVDGDAAEDDFFEKTLVQESYTWEVQFTYTKGRKFLVCATGPQKVQ